MVVVNATGTVALDTVFWSEACKSVPLTAEYVRVEMGDVTDYFRPLPGSSFCDMLTSTNKHLWSPDPTCVGFSVPHYSSDRLGGSAEGWPAAFVGGDSRTALSAWGSASGGELGGCCETGSDGSGDATWNRTFVMWYHGVFAWCGELQWFFLLLLVRQTHVEPARVCGRQSQGVGGFFVLLLWPCARTRRAEGQQVGYGDVLGCVLSSAHHPLSL